MEYFSTTAWLPWILFHVFIILALIVDFRFSRHQKGEISTISSLWICAAWIGLAFLFALAIGEVRSYSDAVDFTTAYLIEKGLSIDNLFVFLVLFQTFVIPKKNQRKILFWGVLGAVVMRALFIFGGLAIVTRFEWILYFFGFALLVLAYQLLKKKPEEESSSKLVAWLQRHTRVDGDADPSHFFIQKEGRWVATRAWIALLAIELTDIAFAIDSIPAVMVITQDPFIAYTSNIFAVLGLRALYIALEGLLSLFHYLHYGLAIVLIFIALKILLSHWLVISNINSLIFIVVITSMTIIASLLYPQKNGDKL